MDVGPTNYEPKTTASRASGRGEEVGRQTLDLMNKNRVKGMERGLLRPTAVKNLERYLALPEVNLSTV